MIKELGERPEGTGTLCLVGEGCSEQGDSPHPFFKHKDCVPRGKERGAVPAIGVSCGSLGLMMGDGMRQGWILQGDLQGERRLVRV